MTRTRKATLTPAQEHVLVTCWQHGRIILRGLDATPGIRTMAVHQCRLKGLLRCEASSSWLCDEYVLTEWGKSVALATYERTMTPEGKLEIHMGPIPPQDQKPPTTRRTK